MGGGKKTGLIEGQQDVSHSCGVRAGVRGRLLVSPSADASAFHLWVGWEVGRGACESWVFSVIFSFLPEGRKEPISPGQHHSDSLGPAELE